MIDQYQHTIRATTTAMPDGNGDFAPFPELLTENELVLFLRIAEISNSRDHHNVIEHLKRYRNLPRIRICNKVLYPTQAIRRWIKQETIHSN
jgi:hypothetical protein